MVLLALALAGCGEMAKLPISDGMGLHPILPPPQQTLIPTVNIAPAMGWTSGAMPVAVLGTRVTAFASGLDHPRWLHTLPNGDVLVAETNAPAKPEDAKGIKGWVMGRVMKWAGAGVPSANRITLLRDTDGDGVADLRSILLEGQNSPFGVALIGQHGSWNRRPHSGYKVIFVPVEGGYPSGTPVDVLTGFLSDKGNALGRPGVVLDKQGALLVADDVGNVIWRVTSQP
ncbi:MAG: hypothetical protein Q7T07_03020 [Burkholderiaceae bacterium]|nr:hypothetical protein [Burkholderiaceae bacterium]